MRVLVPIDGSDCSERALRFGADFARRFDADLHAVHITDVETEATEMILERAREILEDEGIDDDPSVALDVELTFRTSGRVGKDVLRIADEGGYDHVVMGHHGTGAVGRIILGSAATTVVQAAEIPVTVIP